MNKHILSHYLACDYVHDKKRGYCRAVFCDGYYQTDEIAISTLMPLALIVAQMANSNSSSFSIYIEREERITEEKGPEHSHFERIAETQIGIAPSIHPVTDKEPASEKKYE